MLDLVTPFDGLLLVATLVAVVSAVHALLNKSDPRAALGWIAVCLMFPLAGPFFYFLFGINRIRTRARKLDPRLTAALDLAAGADEDSSVTVAAEFTELARISDAVTHQPLVVGNQVEPLRCGEEAYPVMLRAIESARETIFLSTYIFDTDEEGRRFHYALRDAVARGVEVRVLIDGVGAFYSWPRAAGLLRRLGVPVARFLPPRLMPPAFHVNLRNHRKILAVDGRIGFTGGMNLGGRHMLTRAARPSVDMHFRLTGPIVLQLEELFRADWCFVTGEVLELRPPAGSGADADAADGNALCRTVADGPNEDLNKLITILIGAVSAARRRIEIMNPYFLPPRALSLALQAAALRGVVVRVLLPGRNNLPYVHWATRNMLWELLQHRVEIYYQPPPFVHTKLFLVDGHYAQIGSANLDPRSLRLNFEIAVEVYDTPFAQLLERYFEEARSRSRRVTLEEILRRPLPVRVRDAAAWLFSPYL